MTERGRCRGASPHWHQFRGGCLQRHVLRHWWQCHQRDKRGQGVEGQVAKGKVPCVMCLAWVGMSIDLKASLEMTEEFKGVSDTKGQHCLGCSEVLRMG